MIPISVRLSGIVLTQDDVCELLPRMDRLPLRGAEMCSVQDFANVTVIAQATSEGCIRIIDGSNPELSSMRCAEYYACCPSFSHR